MCARPWPPNANSYLGTFVGEFLGELYLSGFFLCTAVSLPRASAPPQRWLLPAGLVAVAVGGMAVTRNAVPAVAPIAAINNAVLPV